MAILPWVETPCLGSHVLGLVLQRLGADWPRKYGHPIELVETFVERERFVGTAYRAANWIRLGQTKGRTRQDAPDGQRHRVPLKDLYVFCRHPQSIQRLRATLP